MINWFNLLANSLWIFGLALALAALSDASWQASLSGEKLRVRLGRSEMQIVLNLAGIFFCAGLAATSQRGWEIGLWVLLAGAFLVQGVVAALAFRKHQLK